MTNVLSFLGWAFLPNLVTGWVQSIYYGFTIRAGDPKPQPGTARYNSHRRIIHILVITSYLCYTIYEADYEIQKASSFYNDLGVSLSANEREIKSRFRRLAAMHHPDKAGADAPDAANFFIHLKSASDTLLDQTKRFAYERFGPDILSWQSSKTIRDFVFKGVLQGTLAHYGVAAFSLYALSLLGYMDFDKFYRWIILGVLCIFEIHVATRPDFPWALKGFNAVLTRVTSHPPYLPFQFTILARKIALAIYIAMSQIGPVLLPSRQKEKAAVVEEKAMAQNLERLEATAKQLDQDSGRLLEMETAPYRGDREATANLQGKMKEWLVQNTIRADPMVRDALGSSFRRRRVDAPAGAKGNR